MKITLYLDGFEGGTKTLALPAVGQRNELTFANFCAVAVRHIRRTTHPTSAADRYISGYDDTYEFAISPDPGLDYRKTEIRIVTDHYLHPQGSERPSEPSYSQTTGNEFTVTTYEQLLVRNVTYNDYSEGMLDHWHTLYHPDPELSIHLASLVYTLSYDANGGQGAPTHDNYTVGQTVTLATQMPTWKWHQFIGWDERRQAINPTYTPTGLWRITPGARNVTLYAIWREKDWTYLPMRPNMGVALLRSSRNGLIIRHGDA